MIVVTGGAGFIGSNLIRALNRRGEREIAVVDRLDRSDRFLNLNALDFVDYVDHGDTPALEELCGRAAAIFHLGACTDTTELDGRYMMETNFSCSKRLLRAAAGRQIPFVYASSAAVYGTGGAGFREDPACERSLNVYAASKQCLDNHVRALLPKLRSPVVGLRYFNVYGPQELHKGPMASVAYHLFGQLRRGGAMQLFEGSRDFFRDFVHVDDAVAVTLELFDRGVSGIFNCGTGRARSFYDVAATLGELWGGGEIDFIPFPEQLEGKYQAHTEADLTRLRAAGSEHRFLSLEQGLGRYHEVLAGQGGYLRR
jgi:ADP-L-glycero-D-manno-heptose 6-epimerase